MKKNLLLLLVVFFSSVASSQSRKNQFYLDQESEQHDLHVSFIGTDEIQTISELLIRFPELVTLISEYELSFEKSIRFSPEKWQELERNATKFNQNAQSVQRLKNIFKVNVSSPTNEKVYQLASLFEKFDFVHYASLISHKPVKPPFDIAPTTPNFMVNQTYIGPNPGLNMQYAWDLGLKGTGIRIRDVEYGFNQNHEDLHVVNAFVAEGMTISSNATVDYTEHGTPVFGIMMAENSGYGITGLVHEASEMILFPEWQQIGYNRILAVNESIAASSAGDVILFEMQADGPLNGFTDYVPAEYNNVIWDLTKAASDAGIIIVAAAGNGNQNLDGSTYQEYMNRGNSGAIIVGAGTPDLNHFRFNQPGWWGSTFGSRVDLQGWARNVYACGYGDVIRIGNDFNQGYTNFSGTSSATPMVAACVVVLQSYHHSLTGEYLTGPQISAILKETGIPQGNPSTGNVGPFPNMQAAVQRVFDDYSLALSSQNKMDFYFYPNPVDNEVHIQLDSQKRSEVTFELYSTLGQLVLSGELSDTRTVNLSHLAKGLYYLQLSDGEGKVVKKIVKK